MSAARLIARDELRLMARNRLAAVALMLLVVLTLDPGINHEIRDLTKEAG